MSGQKRPGPYPVEVRERAVRMVLDHGHEYGSQWEAICSVAERLGPKPETLRLWVRQADKDTGRRSGATTAELAELKRENAELRRANDILKAASLDSRGQRNIASNLAAGVSNPSRLRGRVLSFAATTSRSSWVKYFIVSPFGKYWRSSPFVFSFVPRCHGLLGSAK
jgi:transposase